MRESRKAAQRQRLIDGMVATAARHGYGGASVARVIERAGVSRATFYEHFADRHDCFRAAYRELAAQVASQLQAAGDERTGAERIRGRVLSRLLEGADGDPAAARLLTIEALAAEPDLRQEHERLLGAIERSIEAWVEATPPGWPQLQIPARGLLGGVEGVLAARIFRSETGQLLGLFDDLVGWVGSYALPSGGAMVAAGDWLALGRGLAKAAGGSGRKGGDPPPARPRRARGALSPSEQRRRILEAVARLSTSGGYAEMTVAGIVAESGLSRESFYELFRSKEDAFLDAQAMSLQESISLAATGFFAGETWPDRVWRGLEALLRYVVAHPDFVHLDMVEAYAAGPAAIRRSYENRMAYSLFLEDGYRQRPEAESLPRLCSEAIAAAIQELVRRQVAIGGTGRILEILPQIAYVALAPFMGPGEAMEAVRRRSRRPSGRSLGSPGGG